MVFGRWVGSLIGNCWVFFLQWALGSFPEGHESQLTLNDYDVQSR